jgi:hypothetical protein
MSGEGNFGRARKGQECNLLQLGDVPSFFMVVKVKKEAYVRSGYKEALSEFYRPQFF